MARPFWARFFGINAPTTFAEFRDALLNAPIGQGLGEGRIFERIQALFSVQPDRGGSPAGGQLLASDHHDQPIIATAMVIEHDLASAPPPTSQAGASGGTDAVPAAQSEDSRVFLIRAGDSAQPALPLDRGSLELNIPIGTDPQLLAQLDRDQNDMPSGSWTKIFTQHDYAAIAASAYGDAQYVFDAAGFADMQASGQGFGPGADTLNLSGDFSAGFTLSGIGALGRVSLEAGNDYVLIADDEFVHAGTLMIVDGSRVGAGNHVMFDGSAETDGRFSFYGSGGDDIVFGGADNDWIRGLGGADVLTGGGGADTFIYTSASESTGANYDILADFDPLHDHIDLVGKVPGFDATLQAGSLSDASFSQDLASALAGLGANHAALFRPDSGDLAGTVFLVVDANGVAGYQEGEDYVFALPATTLADLAGHTDFFV